MDERSHEIIARIAAGEDPQEVLHALMAPESLEALRRCCLLRSFDAATFAVLSADLYGANEQLLMGLVAERVVEAVPGRPGSFRVPAEARRRELERWWGAGSLQPPPSAFELRHRLVEHFEARGEPLGALYHLVTVDPERALARFDALFSAADAAGDLPRCRDLVDALGEPWTLTPAVAELSRDRASYLDARGLWLDSWYRTARVLVPGRVLAALEEFLGGHAPRVLVLHGPGGMGKTTLAQWLIARRCVPAPARIPCARLDLDYVDPLLATREPGRVLLEIAKQLDVQLPRRPFAELLYASGEGAPAAIAERMGALLGAVEATRIVIVVDTLEPARGRERRLDGFEPLLAELARVCDAAPAVRLLLASRYDLSGSGIPAGAATLELGSFAPVDSRRFLRMRGVDDEQVVEEAVAIGGGVPFKLALVAEIAEQGATAEELATYHGADIAYLTERVIARIAEPDVRWLLRYGVVARTLDQPFVGNVLAPHLAAAMGDRFDAHATWARLVSYAGDASWLSLDPAQPDSVRFRPEIVAAAREVLRAQPIFAELQRDAVAHFEARAASEPERAADWLREALFHRFELEGPAVARYWRARIEAARAHPAIRLALARELSDPTYAAVAPSLLVEAQFERGLAATELGRATSDPLWDEARESLDSVEVAQSGRRPRVIDPARLAAARSALASAPSSPRDASRRR